MPEIAEIILASLFLNSKFKNGKIVGIKILSGRYKRKPMTGLDGFKKSLPLIIKKVDSKGKFMWFDLYNDDTDYYILNTFGLTGEWMLKPNKSSRLVLTIKKNKKTYELYYSDARNFGTMTFTPDKNILDNKLASLGPDLLKTSFTNKEFYERMYNYLYNKKGKLSTARANNPIVKVLMNQKSTTGLGCGIGNYLSAEILYRAKISPRKKIIDIYKNKNLASKLAESIRYTIKLTFLTADVGYLAHLDDNMTKWIATFRKRVIADKDHKYHYQPDTDIGHNKFQFDVYRQSNDPKGNPVIMDKIIPGRTTYWVKQVQK